MNTMSKPCLHVQRVAGAAVWHRRSNSLFLAGQGSRSVAWRDGPGCTGVPAAAGSACPVTENILINARNKQGKWHLMVLGGAGFKKKQH